MYGPYSQAQAVLGARHLNAPKAKTRYRITLAAPMPLMRWIDLPDPKEDHQ
ncbi:hypothetical protein AB0395_22105 [Streptosporangium sp. NPDC051023]|uniref:hypothetical protein n=1 Tax=Streptosporangium sp. NPDC051023 TaxID=3155410 RepID=UPI00344D4463